MKTEIPKYLNVIVSVTDGNGIEHPIYGDDFAHAALIDILEKLKTYEMAENIKN